MKMNEFSKKGKPINRNNETNDDLTKIKGIGKIRQQWLADSLNVHTFHQLAKISPKKIEAQLRAEGQIVSISEIERWIFDAARLAGKVPVHSESPSKTDNTAVSNPNSELNNMPQQKEGDWATFAAFVVELQSRPTINKFEEQQTTVHHMDTGKGKSWPGIEDTQLCQWMLDQVEESKLQLKNKAAKDKKSQATPSDKNISIPSVPKPRHLSIIMKLTQVKVMQPGQSKIPIGPISNGQLLPGFIKSNQPTTFQAALELEGQAINESAAEEDQCQTHFVIFNKKTGVRKHLGQSELQPIVEGKQTYSAKLDGITLGPGVYRLQVFSTIPGATGAPSQLEIPLIQVI